MIVNKVSSGLHKPPKWPAPYRTASVLRGSGIRFSDEAVRDLRKSFDRLAALSMHLKKLDVM